MKNKEIESDITLIERFVNIFLEYSAVSSFSNANSYLSFFLFILKITVPTFIIDGENMSREYNY